MSFLDNIQEESKKYGANASASDRFEFEKGQNRLRVLTHPSILATHFFGKGNPSVVCVGIDEGCQHHKEDDDKPSVRLITYIIDRKDGQVKLAELPLSISYALNDMQATEGFEFDEFPMPYDVQVMYDPDNKDPKAKYRATGIPKFEPLTDDEQKALDEKMEKMTPEGYVERRKEKQKEKDSLDQSADYPVEEN